MPSINPYLTFKGNCEEAFEFYKSVFKVEVAMIDRFENMPENPEFPIPEAAKKKIMHVSLPIGEGSVLMGSDTMPGMEDKTHIGNNISVSVNPDSVEETKRIFEALSEGGTITMPLEKTFWNAYFGMLIDQFGINWMVNCQLEE